MKTNMFSNGTFKVLSLLVAIVSVILLSSLIFPQMVGAESSAGGGGVVANPSTATFLLEKKFSGPVPEGYTADQFVFKVEGDSFGPETVTLIDFNDDSANGSIELPVGTYTLTEDGPTGFDPSEWTVQWAGAGCDNQTALSTIIEVDESDLDKDAFGCDADNEWRHGILTIEKEVVGATTDVSNFSFVVTHKGNEIFNGPFDDDEVEVAVAVGEYTVVENSAPNYITTYSDECNGTMEEDVRVTCTITNTYDPAPVPGCTDSAANNYDPLATTDDGSCTYDPSVIPGCTDAAANNYDPLATTDDGSCTYDPTPVPGCTDPLAINYNPLATTDDDSCQYPQPDEGIIAVKKVVSSGATATAFEFVASWTNNFFLSDGDTHTSQALTTGTYQVSEIVPSGWELTASSCVSNLQDTETPGAIELNGGEIVTCTFTNAQLPVPAPLACTLTAPDEVEEGEEFDLTWTTTGAEGAEIDNGIGIVSVPNGFNTTSIDTATTFTMTAHEFADDGFYGDSVTCSAMVEIESGGGREGGGGGSRPPRCEFSIEGGGAAAELVWETHYGRELWITANGEEIFRTTDEDEVDEGSFPYAFFADTDFELTVKRYSREETCQVSEGPSFGSGGSNPQPQVLGEQVSVVPVGAPNTGAGGAAPLSIPSPIPFVAALMSRTRNVSRK